MDGMKITELLAEKLSIELPPVALLFVEAPPADVPALGRESPSFCTLWRMAEGQVFYASAEQHLGCAIGGMVSGFVPQEGNLFQLGALLQEMCEEGEDPYQEIAQAARFSTRNGGVVYGPLWKFPMQPQLVLLWASLPQLGVLQEVTGSIMWRNNPQGATFTRPACSVLAIADAHGKAAMSLGCIGMRAYTKVPSQYMLIALPGGQLDKLQEGLEQKQDAQERLRLYEERLRTGQTRG